MVELCFLELGEVRNSLTVTMLSMLPSSEVQVKPVLDGRGEVGEEQRQRRPQDLNSKA